MYEMRELHEQAIARAWIWRRPYTQLRLATQSPFLSEPHTLFSSRLPRMEEC